MSEVQWIRVCTNIFENRKIKQISSLPNGDSIVILWLKLLCLAGSINDNGNIYFTENIPYTEQMLSAYFNQPIATVQFALGIFEQFGMIANDNGMITVCNWEKYQNIEGLEKIKEQTRKRVAKHREKQKLLESNVTCNVTVTQCNATDKNREEKKREDNNYLLNKPINELTADEIAMIKRRGRNGGIK